MKRYQILTTTVELCNIRDQGSPESHDACCYGHFNAHMEWPRHLIENIGDGEFRYE